MFVTWWRSQRLAENPVVPSEETMLPKFNFQNQVNAVGGLAFLIVAGYVGWDLTKSRETPTCGSRSQVATMMSLQKPNGQPMSPAEFQARVGFGERGVVEKTLIRRGDGAQPLVLDVALGGPHAQDSGANFFWSPSGAGKATSACLAYSVLLPDDFDYATGGTLPGLYGESVAPANANGQSGLSTRAFWTEAGQIGVQVNLSDVAGVSAGSQPLTSLSSASLRRGNWIPIEQEVILNSPNAKDGVLRIWIDGRLKLEETSIAWRGTGGVHLMGAMIDVGYTSDANSGDKKQTRLTLSPLRLSWQ